MKRFSFAVLLLISTACGSQREVEPKTPAPSGPSKPAPGGGDGGVTFQEITEITDASCKRCHSTSQFLKTEAAWRDSEAKARLSAKSMPPPGTAEAKNLSEADRSTLISF